MGFLRNIAHWLTEIPGAEETKLNPAWQGVIVYGNLPQPQFMPRNYKSYAQEGYRVDPTIYKCISYISRNGAAIPPKLYTSKERDKEITAHPLLDKLNQPNPEMNGIAYREAVLGYLLIAGNSYQYAIRPSKNGPPTELWTLRPDAVQVMVSQSRGITGYKYIPVHTPTGPDAYDAAEVCHCKYWCPDDEVYGLSPMEVAALQVDQQVAARKWNLALLQNWARLPGAWVTPNVMSKRDRDDLQEKLKEKLGGYRNAGTPPVLDAGLKWESIGTPPAQMDWLNGLIFNAAGIANIYNIAPVLIGDTTAMTFDNMKQAQAYSYTEGVFPDLDKIYAEWNRWLVPMYPDLRNSGAYLYYDKESIEVIQEILQGQKTAIAKRAEDNLSNSLITMNEARILAGYPKLPGGDRIKLGLSLVPIELLKQPVIITVSPRLGELTTPAGEVSQAGTGTPQGGAPAAPSDDADRDGKPPKAGSAKKSDDPLSFEEFKQRYG